MPRATARSSASASASGRRWGTRYDLISRLESSVSPHRHAVAAEDTEDDDEEEGTVKTASESAFGDELEELEPRFASTAGEGLSASQGQIGGEGGRSRIAGRVSLSKSASIEDASVGGGHTTTSGDEDAHPIVSSWADDSFPSPLRSPPRSNPSSFPPHHPQLRDRRQRYNHAASVFVASLPPEPNAVLDELLRGALGKYGSVLGIKFIHDVRSGGAANCAFVQFEHPDEARAAIRACHMSYINGRCIRCEPAKAHRTLLVSFCPAPSSSSPNVTKTNWKNVDARTGLDPEDKFPEWVRIRRPDARSPFVVVTFNALALSFSTEHPQSVSWTDANDPLSGAGTLVSLSGDVAKSETMRTLANLFGPLESFAAFPIPSPEEVHGWPYAPHPASGDTGVGDEAGTYEIKWEQRQDAISALYSLARIPSLMVTWAHEHPHPANYTRGPRLEYGPQAQQAIPRFSEKMRASASDEVGGVTISMTPSGTGDTLVEVDGENGGVSASGTARSFASSTSQSQGKDGASPSAMLSRSRKAGPEKKDGSGNLSPTDFPPLPLSHSHSTTALRHPIHPSADDNLVETSDDEAPNISTEVVPPASSYRGSPTPSEADIPGEEFEDDTLVPRVRGRTMSLVIPASATGAGDREEIGLVMSPETPTFSYVVGAGGRGAESVMLDQATPSSTMSAITPSPQTLPLRSFAPLPPQEMEYASFKQQSHLSSELVTPKPPLHQQQQQSPYVPDSLFVGGLDPSFGWTESRVKELFGKYGDVVAVRIIFKGSGGESQFVGHGSGGPPGHCFVRFGEGKGGAEGRKSALGRAIECENGRTYGMRSLRVTYCLPPHLKGSNSVPRRRFGGGAQGLGQGLGLHGIAGAGSQSRQGFGLEGQVSMRGSTNDSTAPPASTNESGEHADSPPAAATRLGRQRSPAETRATKSPLAGVKPLDNVPSTPATHDVSSEPLATVKAADRRRARAKSDPTTPTRGERAAAVQALFSQSQNDAPAGAPFPQAGPQFAVPPPPFFAAAGYPPEMYWNAHAHAAAMYGMQMMFPPHPHNINAPFDPSHPPFWTPHHGAPPFPPPPVSNQGETGAGGPPRPPMQPTGFMQSENGLFIPSYAFPPHMTPHIHGGEQNAARSEAASAERSSAGSANPSPTNPAFPAWGSHPPYGPTGTSSTPTTAGFPPPPPGGAPWSAEASSHMHAPTARPSMPFPPPHAMNPYFMGGMPGFVPNPAMMAPPPPSSGAPSPMPAHFRPRPPMQINKRSSDSSNSVNKEASSAPTSFAQFMRAGGGGRQMSYSSSSSSLASNGGGNGGGVRPSGSFTAMGPRSMMPHAHHNHFPPSAAAARPGPESGPPMGGYPPYMPYDPAMNSGGPMPPYGVTAPFSGPPPSNHLPPYLPASKNAAPATAAQGQWNVLPAAYDNP